MTRPLLDRTAYDHPEHFDDEIRAYRTSSRYVPTPLEALLFELANHRCTICLAPWLEIHHIDELGDGGNTEYENLIVLCPNCHTRVHLDGIPSKAELRHYKLKQEVAYEFPILSQLTTGERQFLAHVSTLSTESQTTFSKREHREIEAEDQEQAVQVFKSDLGFQQLEQSGMVYLERGFVVTLVDGHHVSVNIHVRLTGKGQKWLRYLVAAGRIPVL